MTRAGQSIRRWRMLASALLALCLGGPGVSARDASICSAAQVRVQVLPFEVAEDFSVPFASLQGDASEVGLVRQTTTVKVDGCSATVGYANPVLYVASELRRDACAFQVVFEHEARHVEIYRLALRDLEQRVRTAALRRPLFDAAVSEVTAVDAEHARFDSADEARKNVTACSGRIHRLAMHRSQLTASL